MSEYDLSVSPSVDYTADVSARLSESILRYKRNLEELDARRPAPEVQRREITSETQEVKSADIPPSEPSRAEAPGAMGGGGGGSGEAYEIIGCHMGAAATFRVYLDGPPEPI